MIGTIRTLSILGIACIAVFAPALQAASENYAGQNLERKNFRDGALNGANFEGAKLKFADFANATLKNANFRNADLESANLRQANLEGADFTGANLRKVTWLDAKARSTKLAGTDIYLARAHIIDTKKLNLDYRTEQAVSMSQERTSGDLSFHSADLRNCKILGNAQGVDFRKADLRGADFSAAENLEEARFKGAQYDDNTRWKIDPAKVQAVHAGGANPTASTDSSSVSKSQSPLVGKWLILKEKGATESGSLGLYSDGSYEWDFSAKQPLLKGKWMENGTTLTIKNGELGQDWAVSAKKADEIELKSAKGDERVAVRATP